MLLPTFSARAYMSYFQCQGCKGDMTDGHRLLERDDNLAL